ncbi:rhomboid family intramembrane serine protease [filamentous cyanobacterium LEGE 11480]|uniref:Rhomboid family intramembrane serine protease n=1 Tax=Romeriopsis navalis LEGE 11480 TaxID=2777977 RepID=A0A928Z1S0_9CYAN|nr:rhomboid family intramembrane serine protease [Romeriopsis navalis]MBE9029641.1 rhomboid family intramembrane serine protease [Romeriopsis navalis LEGE 11480]
MNGFFTAQSFQDWFIQARLLFDLLVMTWVVAVVDLAISPRLITHLGALKPRKIIGLPGIISSAFLHGNWQHLTGNTAYYLIFGGMIVVRDARDFPIVSLMGALIPGILLWLFGRHNGYVGASGVIFAYIGFVVSLIYFYRDPLALMFFVAMVLSLFFGDLIIFPALSGEQKWVFGRTLWGLFPSVNGRIAWEAHLLGFIGGIWIAWRLNDLHTFFKPIFAWWQTTWNTLLN